MKNNFPTEKMHVNLISESSNNTSPTNLWVQVCGFHIPT